MTALRKKSYFIKKELVYFGILIFSVFVIYQFFGRAFSDVQIGEHSELANVFLLTVNNYLYMLAGLLLLGFTLYIYMHMKAYMAGKLFTLYLLLITIGICLAAVNYDNQNVNLYIALLMCVSNIILYYLIGRLILTATKKFFRRLSAAYLLLVFGMIFGMAYVQRNHLAAFPGKIVMFDYAITIILIFVNLIYGYKGATVYSKQQIKCLINGILSGIVIFVVMQFMPTVAVVGIMGQADDTAVYSRISVENINFIRGILPIAILIGIIVAITYLFIKREYVSMEDDYELRRYMISILYLVAANTCFRLLWINGVTEFIVLNMIIILPLLVSSYQSYLRKGTVYDSKMVEVLEDERQRLSVFLHDEILQDLISFSYVLKSEQEKERLSAMIGEIRRISQELYPIIVEDLGVDAALEIFLADIKSDYNVEIEYRYTCPGGVLPAKISMVLYRTVKELVMNAMKHSCCRHMEITVGKEEHEIVCIVTDDGKGFQIPENEDLLKSPYMGIYVMKKQIAEGIAAQLDGQEGISVLGVITEPALIFRIIDEEKPDAVLMDIRMGEYNGIKIADEIKQAHPETKIILMSGYNISNMAKASHADAFTSKEESISSLILTIRKVCIDHAVVFPNAVGLGVLTNMEIRVLELISQDKRRKEIAKELYVSEKTVTNHISSILAKLGVRSRVGAIMKGVELGLIDAKQ